MGAQGWSQAFGLCPSVVFNPNSVMKSCIEAAPLLATGHVTDAFKLREHVRGHQD